MNIQNSVVIVTGASMGIGKALAIELGKRGARVVLAARSEGALQAAAENVPNALVVPTDVTNSAAIDALVQRTLDQFGRVDVLVNNAGQGMQMNIEDIVIDDYRTIIELNVIAPLIAMQKVIPLMRAQGAGTILNISSMVSKNYYPGLAAYSSTKYALNALTLTARAELAGDGIIVSAFHPKMTATDFGANSRGKTYDSKAGRPGMQVDTAEDVAIGIADQIQSGDAEVMM